MAKCKNQDCFNCPYPDCIDEAPLSAEEKKKRIAESKKKYAQKQREKKAERLEGK